MGFITSLFGGSENTLVTVVLSLTIVLVMIVLGVWILKVIFQATGNVTRGRNKRLSVIDSMAIDPKRQLVLVRRDNVEHLVLLGGSTDLVVETDIPAPTPLEALKNQRVRPNGVATKSPLPSDPDLASTSESQTNAKKKPVRSRSLRHTGLLRAANRQEPDLNPQILHTKTSFDEANTDDSAKSENWNEDDISIPEVSSDVKLDGNDSVQKHRATKKRRRS